MYDLTMCDNERLMKEPWQRTDIQLVFIIFIINTITIILFYSKKFKY
jgi:hypothetical protein